MSGIQPPAWAPTVPFPIAHGANDRQMSVDYAHQSYDQAVSSPKRELRILTVDEGTAEHGGLDHMPHIDAYVADWVEDTLAELSAGRYQGFPRTLRGEELP